MAYKRSVYQQAKEALDQRRAQAERLGQQRRAEIAAQCPAILETEREMAACGAELIKVACRGEQVEQKIAALSQRNLDAQKQRAKLLQDMGYAPDYLDNVYTCPICKDTGTHGNYYCTCYLDLIRQTAKENIKGAAQLKKCTFETFSLRYYSNTPDPALGRSHREIMRRISDYLQSYADTFSLQSKSLLMMGKTGLGKTHLLLAIEHALRVKYPNMIVIYTTCEDLINELLQGMRNKNTVPFREKYRNADALLVDDIQFIQKGESFQEEFFHTFDTLYRAKKQIVMTSDEPPRNMTILTERLRSRFEMGVLADIQPPDIETRKAIIYKKCDEIGFTLDEEIVNYIAQNIKNNIRQLEGTVHKIFAMTQTFRNKPTLADVENIIKDITSDSQPVSVKVEKIIDYVANAFGVTAADIKSDKRQSDIKLARQVAMYVIKEVTALTLQEIGNIFDKNHSTVIYSIDQIKKTMDKNPQARMVAASAVNEFNKG